ncbi:hypothetical protein PoB_002714000 [Plakobranchus ocellatus]|uniref:G-protein coupled receptors family 1 profile domain-containing protein n=1 Tax=Plakobranchus ocellatus TaxID=259542 RepID=A0AAV3ZZL5_9GAST|nr:hypothetical protein PoB_002714000 [Plakobranchus ocellatus]
MDSDTQQQQDSSDYNYMSVERQYEDANRFSLLFSSALFGLGTILNLWFVIAILTSPFHRVKLRNQLICNLSIFYLAVALVKSPIMLFYSQLLLQDFEWATLCDSLTLSVQLELVSNFIQDWLIFFIVTDYLTTVARFDPSKWLHPRLVNTGKFIIHILPWIASPALYPLLVPLLSQLSWCITPLPNLVHTDVLFTMMAPVVASIVITFVAYALTCWRGSRHADSQELEHRLITQDGQIDNPLVYVFVMVVSVACEAAFLISVFMIATKTYVKLIFLTAACEVSDARSVLMMLPWLLFPDIRDRLKSWRPWPCIPEPVPDSENRTELPMWSEEWKRREQGEQTYIDA